MGRGSLGRSAMPIAASICPIHGPHHAVPACPHVRNGLRDGLKLPIYSLHLRRGKSPKFVFGYHLCIQCVEVLKPIIACRERDASLCADVENAIRFEDVCGSCLTDSMGRVRLKIPTVVKV